MREYTVKEFAALAKITPQGVYRHVNNPSSPLQPFIKKVDGRTMIEDTALETVFGVVQGVQQEDVQVDNRKTTATESHTEALIASLNEQIEFLKAQIQQKDNQIAELLTLSTRALNTTSQQQYLTAVATTTKSDEQSVDQQINPVEQPEQQIKKRSWLSWFTG